MVLKRKHLARSDKGNIFHQPVFTLGHNTSSALNIPIKSGLRELKHSKHHSGGRVQRLAKGRGAYE